MAIILDTQILIWLEHDPERIPHHVKTEILQEPLLYLSKASVWEMAIKIKTGKLFLNQPLETFVENFVTDYSCELLNINLQHIYHTQNLPFYHRDPFDRLIISQSLVEDIPIVSADAVFKEYGLINLW